MAGEVDVVIEGAIVVDDADVIDGFAVAQVSLRDVAFADAPSRQLASTRIAIRSGERRIPFRLAARIDPAGDHALSAEVRCAAEGSLRPGDLATVARQPWRPGDGPVDLKVVPID